MLGLENKEQEKNVNCSQSPSWRYSIQGGPPVLRLLCQAATRPIRRSLHEGELEGYCRETRLFFFTAPFAGKCMETFET